MYRYSELDDTDKIFDCQQQKASLERTGVGQHVKEHTVSNNLGDKVRALRKAKDFTLEKLAELTYSSKGYIWELENRDTRKPSAEKLMKIAEVLGVTTEFLLDENRSEPDDEVMKTAFFRKFGKLKEPDQKKLMKIIDEWAEE